MTLKTSIYILTNYEKTGFLETPLCYYAKTLLNIKIKTISDILNHIFLKLLLKVFYKLLNKLYNDININSMVCLMQKFNVLKIIFYLPDILFLYFAGSYFNTKSGFFENPENILYFSIIYILSKALMHFFGYRFLFLNRVSKIRAYIQNFKRGNFTIDRNIVSGRGSLSQLIRDLNDVGRHFENMVLSQKNEINKFKEFYNNIVLSVSSYFLVLNEKNEIIFANKSFNNNFNFALDEITGNSISDLFYFSAGQISETIEEVKRSGDSVVLRQTHLLSKNRIAIIADVKVSRITIHGETQIVIVMDDITSKCRKDYQISIISQISESIQKDDEIERVLFAILTAVTSGSGLGFNRAMLFLHNRETNLLEGKMAVGPDSVEEAVQIWGAVKSEEVDILKRMEDYNSEDRKGIKFYEKVIQKHYNMISGSILVKVLKEQRSYHVKDAWNDTRIDPETRDFIDVSEFVAVPLIAGNRAIGVIIADNKYNHAPIWQDNIELLSIFAVQAALSIESCKNLTSVRSKMEKIQQRQDAIVESEKMAAVGRIAAHIAHEIRNPLVTVGGYARRILQIVSKGTKNPEGITQSAEVILKESERLEKILSNVMDFTRPSPYIKEYNDLNSIINDTVSLLNNVFQERKIDIEINLEEKLPLIKSDFNQLKQVILNLIQNAMDATSSGGKVEVSTRVEKDKAIISVADNGTGIEEQDIPNLFEPFFTTKVTGVGLGLAVVKRIINDHDGEISAVNREGGGAEFKIEFKVPV